MLINLCRGGQNKYMKKLSSLVLRINKKYALLVCAGLWCALLQSTFSLPLLALVSYAPMMHCLCRYRSRREFAACFVCFFVPYYFYQLAFLVTVYDQLPFARGLAVGLLLVAVAALTLWESLVMFLPVYLFTHLRCGKVYDAATLAVLIAGGEWLQENLPFLSFPWSSAWLSVTDEPLFLQPASLLGCRAVTVLLLTANGLFAFALTGRKRIMPSVCLAAVMCVWLGFGWFSLVRTEKLTEQAESISVVIAQDEMQGSKKSGCTAWDCARSYRKIISSAQLERADLVVLPETAVPMSYDGDADEFSLVSALAKQYDTTVVNGCFFTLGDDEYNALYAVDKCGNVSEPYFKQVLVPFGEKIPFAFLFGCSTLCECSSECHTKPLETAAGRIGCAICIESIYPETVRKQAAQGAQILCVCTNDSWFGKSYARQMHFRHSVMRAVENGRYLLRSGNCGISAVIKPTGEVQSIRTQTSKGVITDEARLLDECTLYSRFKDLFTVLPALLTAIAIMRMYKSKNTD